MLKQIIKNKKIWYAMAGLTMVLLVFVFYYFNARADKPVTPSSLQQYVNGTSTAITNGSWITNNNVYLTATSSDASNETIVMYYQLVGNGTSLTTSTTSPTSFCDQSTPYNSCSGKIWANATNTPNWFKGYKYRTPVTILASRVAGTLTNFPVYFSLARLGTSNDFWSRTKKNSDGGDLLMTTSDGTTQIPLEVVAVSTSTKTGELYFRASSISSSSNITFYLYYGSSTAAQPASSTASIGSQQVWSNGYVSVYHFNSNANDSKGNNRGTVTNAPASTVAKVGGYSYYFDGDGDYITLANEANFDFTGPMAVETWVNASGFTDAWQAIVAKVDTAWRLARSNSTNYPDFARSGGGNASGNTISINNTGWHNVVGTFDGTYTRIFTDASNEASTNNTGLTSTNNNAVTIGRNGGYAPARDWYGYIDEVRISNVNRINKWITTTYNNINSPSTFFSTSTDQYYLTPSKKAINIPSVPDSSTGYKWQALACDEVSMCSPWQVFNASQPNFKVDTVKPTAPGALTLNSRGDTSVTLNFGATTTETFFAQYKIFYKAGTSGVRETDSMFGSSSDSSLGLGNYGNNTSVVISGLRANTQYVFNIWAYDQAGQKASSAAELVVTTKNFPSAASTLSQRKADGVTTISNGTWTAQNQVNLTSTSTDANSDFLVTYYQLATTSGSFLTATTAPSTACVSGTAYGSCPSRVWINSTAYDPWFDPDYGYRVKITVQSSKVGSALNNFPVYVNLANLGNANAFWSRTRKNSSGGDLMITNLAGARLPLEVVSVSTSTKSGEIYFKADSLSSLANTDFYLYYGSSTASQPSASSIYGSQNVWTNGYKAVWHLSSITSVTDSTGAHNGTVFGNPTNYSSGKVGGSIAFDGAGDYINTGVFGAGTVDFGNSDYTASFWIRPADTTAGALASKGTDDTTWSDQEKQFFFSNATAAAGNGLQPTLVGYACDWSSSASTVTSGAWSMLTFNRFDSSNVSQIYVNAAKIATSGAFNLTNTADDPSWSFFLGRRISSDVTPNEDFNGSMDEVRLSNVTRPTTWISTEYNNQNSPGTFYSTSSEQAFPIAYNKLVNITSIPDSTVGYKWQALVCDADGCAKTWTPFNVSSPNFSVDTVTPTFSNSLNPVASTTNYIRLTLPTAATETNFYQYKLYYRLGSTTPIHETDSVISSSTSGYSYFGSQTFQSKSSTTIYNLATGTVYSFSLWAYDRAGNKASTSLVWERTDRLPSTAVFNSAAERTDGTGRVDLSFTVDDLDRDVELMAKAEYIAGTSCKSGTLSKMTLDQTPANVSATYGAPVVQNKNTYQIGTSTGWIITSSGANTISVDWMSKTDLPSADGVYCLKITVDDNRGGYRIATTTMYIDNVKPTAPGPLTFSKRGNYKINPYLNATSTETNFSKYKIFYKIGFSGVTEADSEFSSSTNPGDPALGDKNYLHHATTSVTGLAPGTQYAFNIWVYDTYGNKASGTAEFTYNTTGPPNVFDHAQYRIDGSTVIANGSWTNDGEVNLYATSTNDEAGTPVIYYQLATTSGTFITATGTPANACSSGTAYAACLSKVWYSSKLVKANIKNIPTNDYKWQALACNGDGCSKNWVIYNASAPNFRMDVTAPSSPGNLTLNIKNDNSVTVNFGSAAVEDNFKQYKVFYKVGSSGTKETNSLFGSSTTPGDSGLGFINYGGVTSITITGLYSNTQYVFNVWAYDLAGNKASGTAELVVTTKNFPAIASSLNQYKSDGVTVIPNGNWTNENQVKLTATSTDADSDFFVAYYQLATTSGAFLTATTVPSNICQPGTAYASCPSRVWANATTTTVWRDPDYGYRIKFTVPNSQVSAAQTNFPVYVNLANLGTANNFWSHTKKNSDGGDLMVTNSAGVRLPLEVVSISTSTKSGEIYFKADSLSSSANTDFYVYYGSSTASQPAPSATYGSQNVWANGYRGVWHLNEGAGASAINDSTSYGNSSSTLVGAPTLGSAGKLGNAVNFSGINQILVEQSASLKPTTNISYSIWMNAGATQGTWAKPMWFGENDTGPYWGVYGFEYNNTSDTDIDVRITDATAGYPTPVYTTTASTWNYLTGAYDGSATYLYVNGVQRASTTWVNGTIGPYDSVFGLSIGDRYQGAQGFVGLIDEVRIASVSRSKSWVSTEYNNQNNPAAFYSTSSEQVYTTVRQKQESVAAIPDSATGYKWQVLFCDADGCSRAWEDFNATTPNFNLDATASVFSNTLNPIASTTNSITLALPAPASELNFWQYKLYYRLGSTTSIHETDSVISSSTSGYSYFGSQSFSGKSSTTITGLATGTVYSFSLWAYDKAGNKASSSLVWERTDRSPNILSFNSASQRTDGTGRVDLSVTLNDLDWNAQMKAKVEYIQGVSCIQGVLNKATLDETDNNTSASYGDPKVQNKNAYQIGTSTGYIISTSTPNILNFDWLSQTDLPSGDGTYCLRITLDDSLGGHKEATTLVTIDNLAPTAPGNLSFSKKTYSKITLFFGSASTETNFSQYKIFYKAGTTGVTEADKLFGPSLDSALYSRTYLGRATTTVTNLLPSTDYVFNIWAYDMYGNKSYAVAEYSTSTNVLPGYFPYNPVQYRLSTSSLMLNGGWTNNGTVNLYATSTNGDGTSNTIYYEVIDNSGSFTTATSQPAYFCQSGTSFSGCTSKLWVSAPPVTGWYDPDYRYRAAITVQSSQITGALSDFPVYVDLSGFSSAHSFWKHTKKNSDGGDLVMTNSDGTTRIPIEVVAISTSTQAGELYFKAASISSSSNSTFYLYYGSSTASQPASSTATIGSQNVWDSGFKGVFHFGATSRDSTSNSSRPITDTSVTNTSIYAVGNSSAGFTTAGTNAITYSATGPMNIYGNTPITVETWIRYTALAAAFQQYFAKGDTQYLWQKTNANPGVNQFCIYDGGWKCVANNSTVSTGNWYYTAGTYNGVNGGPVNTYENGVLQTANNTATTITQQTADAVAAGGYTGRFTDGYIDETRVSNVRRSGKWISTTYNNEKTPSSFYAVADEQSYFSLTNKAIKVTGLPDSGYKWQAIACNIDGNCSPWTKYDLTTPNFNVDTVAPTSAGSLTPTASTTDSIKLQFGSASTETNFYQYKIYYKIGSTTPIHETDSLFGSSSDANLLSRTFNGKSSTTISGLATNTVYSFSLWAYDLAGNKSSSSLTWERTDRLPTASISSAAERIDGTGRVDIALAVNDPDRDNQLMAKVEYVSGTTCAFGTLNKATLDETDANTTATYGDPKVQNKNAYQIGTSTGWILTSSGANTVNFVWSSKTDLPAGDGTYCLRVTVNDNRGGTIVSTITLTIDNTAPTGFGPLTLNKKDLTSITPNFNAAATESHFRQYKIFYKAGTSGVRETDTLFSSTTVPGDSALFSQTYSGHSTTSITGLIADTNYVFNIWAYDAYGNKSSSTSEFTTKTKARPTGVFNSAALETNGTGRADISINVNDNDGDNTLSAKLEYFANVNCTGSPLDPTLDENQATITAASGTPIILNSSNYQIGNPGGYIPTSDGANTINFNWLSKTDIPDIEGTYCLRLTVNDGIYDQAVFATTSLYVDNKAPTGLGSLTLNKKVANTAFLNFGAQAVETNFSRYRIFYRQGDVTVAETDNEKIDAHLNSQTFAGFATTSISSLENGYWYAANIWAYDTYGNKASATPVHFKINKKPNDPTSFLQVKSNGAVIDNEGISDATSVNLKAYVVDTDSTSTTFYFELLAEASSFSTATSVPASTCSSGTAFGSCSSKIWAAATSSAPSDWYNSTWAYRKKITISHAQVAGALSGFPVLISLASDADLAARARSDGHDIVFTSSNGRTPLSFEKEEYIGLTGKASFWVKTDLSSVADTYIYVYYGNPSQTSDLSSANVWDSSAQAVWHLAEAGTSARNDSTVNANNAAANNYDGTEKSQTGKIANADYLNGFNKFLSAPSASSLNVTGNLNVSGWINPSSFAQMIGLETGGYPRYQFVGLKWAAAGATDCTADGAFDPKMINPYAGALYGNSSWTAGSSWNYYDTSLTSVYYGANQYSIDLNKVWGNVAANSEAYIGSYIYSPDNRSVNISRGSDDGSQLWVNGHLVSNDCNAHALTVDAITSAVNLKQGWNTIIMRVANGTADWAGVWRISSNAAGLLTTSGSRVLVDKQAYQVSLKGKYLSAFYGTTTVDVAIASNTWQYFTLAGDSSNVEIFVNGVSQGSASFSSAATANSQPIQLGNNYSGIIDEVRVENTKRSAAWMTTSYNNQNNPSAFASLSIEQTRTGMGNTASVISIPDSSTGYKWQVMACDEENLCSNWTAFNAVTPNFKVDANAPTAPGALTFSKKTGNSITLAFGSATTDPFFSQYKIFYKQGSSGVKESDSLFGSSSDAHLSVINYSGAATTTISGLANNTQYVFNIWAYDTSGRKASATSELTATTNAAPTAIFVSAAERGDATGRADISFVANDANLDPLKAKLEYVAGSECNFSTPLDPTLDETDYTATSTYGDPKVLNSNAYQIGNSSGWIITTSGANTVNFDWLTPLDLPAANNTYCLRLTANDGTEDQLVIATTTLTVDNLKPTAPGALTIYRRGAGALVLGFGAPTVETNFSTYKIFYKQGTGVTENDTQLIDANLGYINYNGRATTTATGLVDGQQYSFKIYAYDAYGHKTSSTETIYTTDHLPTGIFNSAAQNTDGSGNVNISVNINDPDGDSALAKLEYFANLKCTGAPNKATVDTGNITATFGTPNVNNSNAYQIGDTSKIITSSGANTINFNWLSATDLPTGDGVYCLRLTANDGQSDQAVAATTSLIIDNAAPTGLGNLTISRANGNSIFLGFGTPAVDSNFKEYKIFYKVGMAAVTEADSAFTKLLDANLGYVNFRGKATTSVATLNASTQYSFNIWAYDQYGNKASSSAQVSSTTNALAGATWREDEDTVDPTGILYLGKEKAVRVRIAVANTGDWESTANKYKVQYATKAATCAAVSSWFDVPTTTSADDFAMTSSGYFYNGEPTVQRFNNIEGYSYNSGSLVEAPSNQTGSTTIKAHSYSELEYDFQATTNATAGRTYCFRVLKDNVLLDAYSRYPELTLSPPPDSSFVSALEKTNGSDRVGVTLQVSHPAGYQTRVKLEYVATSTCDFTTPLKPLLDNSPASVSATYGLPDIDNSEVYQVGSTTGNMIITAYGANTVAFEWPTQNNFSNVDKTYCLRSTAYDGYDNQLALATTTFVIDQVKPTNPGDLTAVFKTATSATLGFGSVSSDTHFKEYRIYYKEGTSTDIVTPSDSLWGSSSDPNLGHDNFQGATNTVITNLPTNKQYVFRIFAYDFYGHIASSSGQVSVYLWSTKRSSGPWRWYQDQYNETPVMPLAGEKVTPNDVTSNQTIKLRMAFQEVEGIDALKTKVRLQYSTYPDFSADVNWVGEKGSTTDWNYGEGVDNDGDSIINLLLSTTTVKMTHNESGISTSSATQPANSWGEWEFTLHNNGAASGTTYYFRGYDTVINKPIPTVSGQAYPNLITSAGSLTINVAGLPSGTLTEGVTTNASTTGTSIPFGVLLPGNEAIGAQRFTITTNAEWGYSLYAYQTSNLISNSGSIIEPVSSDNSAPAAWPSVFSPSVFGYHTGDDTLSGASPSRFAPDNTYARFEENTKEISFSSVPVVSDTFDLIFRVGVGSLQPAGDFRNSIIYILVPTF